MRTQQTIRKIKLILNYIIFGIIITKLNNKYGVIFVWILFKNDIANQFGHNVFYNNVLIRVFYYLLEKRFNTRILFLMTTYRRVLVVSAPAWDGTGREFDSWQCRTISHIEPTTWVPSGWVIGLRHKNCVIYQRQNMASTSKYGVNVKIWRQRIRRQRVNSINSVNVKIRFVL